MRILIAEDELELAKGLKFLLEKNKFTVDVVHDGEEALTYFRSRDYDVAVLDIMMPKVSGLDVLRQIREAGSYTDLLTQKTVLLQDITVPGHGFYWVKKS